MSDKPFANGTALWGRNYSIKEGWGRRQCRCKDCQRASGTSHIYSPRREDVAIAGRRASYASVAERPTSRSTLSGVR
jgi:hypothetical protein